MLLKHSRIHAVVAVAISLTSMTVQGQARVSRSRKAQDSQAAFAQEESPVSRPREAQDSQAAFAQGSDQFVDVVATGYGTTVREATKAALRSAVEQVVGTMIDATTLLENDKLIEDEILSYSAGMIASSKLVGEPKKSEDGLYIVKVKASVKKSRLREKLRATSAVNVALDGADLFARMTAAKDNLADAEAMIKSVLAKHKDCIVAETIPGRNGKSPIDLDPKTGEVFVNVRVRVDQVKYTQFANEVVEKISPMATTKIKIKAEKLKPGYVSFRNIGNGDKKYKFLVMTSLKTGSAVAFQLDKNILASIFSCLDTGSLAIEVTLYDATGMEIAQSHKAMCKNRISEDPEYLSLFACYDDPTRRQLGFVLPFYSSEYRFASGYGYESEVQSDGTFQISLGKFAPEELKSVGKLELKVGHMKDKQFSE